MILNQRERKNEVISVKIGNESVCQEKSAKLLGITFDANHEWKTQIYGTGGVISSINRRLFTLRRLKYLGLFMSKIRFGLQLIAKVRLCESDPVIRTLKTYKK